MNHQKEVQRILAQQALEHSASRLAEMQSKLDTQELGVNSRLNVFNIITAYSLISACWGLFEGCSSYTYHPWNALYGGYIA